MLPRQITQQNILRVLVVGFGLVILLLVSAAVVGVRNIQSIQQNAGDLVREQSVANHLIDELHRQQTSLTEVFSIMARDPDSLNYLEMLAQLDEADRDIDRISVEGQQTPERALWFRLKQASTQFSEEARRILNVDAPETFAPVELFRDHEDFISVVAKLVEAEYRKVSMAQQQIDQRASKLLQWTVISAGASVLLALLFAAVTIRMSLHLIQRLESQTAELGRVSWHMLENQEATARRFSHELHDELGQQLTAMKTNLTAIDSSGQLNRARLEDCLTVVDEAIGNVRQMSQLLRPTILDDFGLEAGLRWLAEGFATRTNIEVNVVSNYSGRLADEAETHLFRIAQEAMTNIARHSNAKHVDLKLESRGGEIYLIIHDDGQGLAAVNGAGGEKTGDGGLGMIGMRARARSAGGDVEVRSEPGRGVLIEVRVPLRDETHSNTSG